MNIKLQSITIAIVMTTILLGFSKKASANGSSFLLYPGGDDPDGLLPNQSTNTVFYDRTFDYFYPGGMICLSSQDGVCTPPATDDAVRIYVDGTEVYYEESYTHDFDPVDFSEKLHTGLNVIRVQLIDLMGPSQGGSALWLVTTPLKPDNGTANGACPGYNYALDNFEGRPEGNGSIWLRESPSSTAMWSGGWQMSKTMTVLGYTCSEGYTWVKLEDPTDPNNNGWYSREAPFELPSSGESAQPTVIPPEPTQTALPLPPDGPSYTPSFWCFLPDFCVEAAEVNVVCHPQCVETARKMRPDLVLWGGTGTSDAILAMAQSKPQFTWQGQLQQVRVRDSNEKPQSGDLVIWPSKCEGAWNAGGHIGYVSNGEPFSVTDSNWGDPISETSCAVRINKPIPIKSCMKFITQPYMTVSLDSPELDPATDESPSGTPRNSFFDWLRRLFSGK